MKEKEADSGEELLACIDKEHVKYLQAGQIAKYIFPLARKNAHINNVPHLIVRLFIIAVTPKNEILYLVQKRGKTKRSYPGYFTDSASGHVLYKKGLDLNDVKENALRELEEEFGILSKQVQKIFFYRLDIEEDRFTTEIAYIFLGLINYDIKLLPNPKELEINGSKFYAKSELEKILTIQKMVDYAKKIWNILLNKKIKDIFAESPIIKENIDVALFIGRFQPIHLGHLYVIKQILKTYKKIKIGIGSAQLSNTKNDPFTSEERRLLIRTALEGEKISSERYELFDLPDVFNANIWIEYVVSIIGNFDIVYSNSDWVRQLFQNKGYPLAEKILFDEKKYNATNIRNAISKGDNQWLNLVPLVIVKLLENFNAVERIKSLYRAEEKS